MSFSRVKSCSQSLRCEISLREIKPQLNSIIIRSNRFKSKEIISNKINYKLNLNESLITNRKADILDYLWFGIRKENIQLIEKIILKIEINFSTACFFL